MLYTVVHRSWAVCSVLTRMAGQGLGVGMPPTTRPRCWAEVKDVWVRLKTLTAISRQMSTHVARAITPPSSQGSMGQGLGATNPSGGQGPLRDRSTSRP